jgi:hypothetical protein
MDGRMKTFGKIVFLIVLLGVASCRDPVVDLLGKLEDDVKDANGLYLEVVSITPSENIQNFNPGDTIRIEFDRPIVLSTFEESFSLVNAEDETFESELAGKMLSYSFNKDNNVLSIAADPYLDGLEDYKLVLLNQLKGEDGSFLRESLTHTFKTSDAPRGSLRGLQNFTNETSVDLEITSQGATYYAIANTEAGLSSAGWQEITSGKMVITDVPITGSDGSKPFFIKLRDGAVNEAGSATVSNAESTSVIYDTTAPEIVFSGAQTYSNALSSAPLTADIADLSGAKSYLWEEVGTSAVSIGAASSLETTASAGSDGTYTLKLTVTDKAGNSGSKDFTYIRDSVGPEVNVSDTATTKSNTNLTFSMNSGDSVGTVDSGISKYEWSKVSGPGSVTFDDTTAAEPVIRVSTEGTYNIKVAVYDNAGNKTEKPIVITCSNTAPVVKISSSVYYFSSNNPVSATVSAGAITWSSPDGVTFTSPNSASTTANLPASDGTYTITCTADNGIQTVATATIVKDTLDPVISITGSPASYPTTLYSSVTESNIASYSWTQIPVPGTLEFGSSSKPYTTIYTKTDGSYTVRLTVADKAGNSASDTITFNWDKTAPAAPSVTWPADGMSTSVSFAISGGTGQYRYQVDGSKWSEFTSSTKSLKLSYGSTQISFQQADAAGNWSTSSSKGVVIYPDSTTMSYPAPKGGVYVSGSDLAWYDLDSRYSYVVEIGTNSSEFKPLGGYRSSPYVDSSELYISTKVEAYFWRVNAYTYNRLTRKYEYVTTYPNPKSGYSYFYFLPK